jgi:hypothetical protein
MPKRKRKAVRFVEVPWNERGWERVKEVFPSALVSVCLPMKAGVEEQALRVAGSGAPIIHLEASDDGTAVDDPSRAMKDVIRSVHRALVEGGVRDEVTLLVGGGIAMAEHVAKVLICGADAVVIDFPSSLPWNAACAGAAPGGFHALWKLKKLVPHGLRHGCSICSAPGTTSFWNSWGPWESGMLEG